MSKIFQLVTLLIFFSGTLISQEATIAVLEFINKPKIKTEYREMLENAFSQAAKNQGRYAVLERTDIEKILATRELQKSESYLDAEVAEQGKALGADYLVIGEIAEGGALDATHAAMGNYPASRHLGYRLILNVRIVSTATAEVLFSHQQKIEQLKEYGATSTEYKLPSGNTPPELIEYLMGNCRNYAHSIYFETFPPVVQILEVEASGKKAKKVTIGTSAKLHNRQIIEVFEEEVVEVDGESISRKIKIGELDMMEMQGEKLARCYVKDGGKEILAFFNEGKKLICQVNNWKLRGMMGAEADSFLFRG